MLLSPPSKETKVQPWYTYFKGPFLRRVRNVGGDQGKALEYRQGNLAKKEEKWLLGAIRKIEPRKSCISSNSLMYSLAIHTACFWSHKVWKILERALFRRPKALLCISATVNCFRSSRISSKLIKSEIPRYILLQTCSNLSWYSSS